MTGADLRASILQAAVQGKLVPQDKDDEPASVLLERVRAVRAELVKQKKMRAPRDGESVITRCADGTVWEQRGKGAAVEITDEVPFDIPDGWEWARLGSVVNIVSARRVHKDDWRTEGVPFYRAREIVKLSAGQPLSDELFIDEALFNEFSKTGVPQSGDLMVTGVGTIGTTYIVKPTDRFYYKDASVLCFENRFGMMSEYLALLMKSPLMMTQIRGTSAGTTVATITMKNAVLFFVPVPPIAEQQRIVAKIDELMPLVERYDKLDRERTALNAAVAGDMRASILQAAVQGALTDCEPTDEPASELLERIREERRELVKQKKAKTPKGGESVITRYSDGTVWEQRGKNAAVEITDEIPFDIPDDWEWTRLESLAWFGGGHTPSTGDKSNFAEDGILWVTSKDMKRDYIDSTLITLSVKGASRLELYKPGTLLMVTRSGILRRLLPVAMLTKEATVNQDQKAIVPFDFCLSPWLMAYLKASDYRIRTEFGKAGTTVESVVFDKVKTMLVPFPPFAEQQRIVAKLDEVLPRVERLGEIAS